jgi:hypothetical protein
VKAFKTKLFLAYNSNCIQIIEGKKVLQVTKDNPFFETLEMFLSETFDGKAATSGLVEEFIQMPLREIRQKYKRCHVDSAFVRATGKSVYQCLGAWDALSSLNHKAWHVLQNSPKNIYEMGYSPEDTLDTMFPGLLLKVLVKS